MHVIVATPGRLVDLVEKGVAKVKNCGMVVLDEADKLLSMDVQHSLENLLSFTPKDVQVLLFSATYPLTVESFMVRWIACNTSDHRLPLISHFIRPSWILIG